MNRKTFTNVLNSLKVGLKTGIVSEKQKVIDDG